MGPLALLPLQGQAQSEEMTISHEPLPMHSYRMSRRGLSHALSALSRGAAVIALAFTTTLLTGAVTPASAQGPPGYYLVGAKGNLYNFGSAVSKGSEAGKTLPAPIVGMAIASDGYYLVGAKGNVYNFGGAPFRGSMADKTLPAPIVGMAVQGCGPPGYYLVGAKGNVYNFGERWHGSAAGKTLPAPIVGIEVRSCADGYYLAGAKGNVYNFGDDPLEGSEAGKTLPAPIVGISG